MVELVELVVQVPIIMPEGEQGIQEGLDLAQGLHLVVGLVLEGFLWLSVLGKLP
jgi:hypothetical protein